MKYPVDPKASWGHRVHDNPLFINIEYDKPETLMCVPRIPMIHAVKDTPQGKREEKVASCSCLDVGGDVNSATLGGHLAEHTIYDLW